MRVLVVDDSEPVRSRLVEMLSDTGLEVESAACVTEASRAIQARAPDVVILDMRMPDGSGLDLLHAIRAAGLPAKVIVLTSCASPHLRRKCLDAGADFCLDKFEEFQRVAPIVALLAHGML